MARKKKENYVNNGDLLVALIRYKEKLEEADEKGLIKPIIPNYIGECIMLIAKNLAKSPNFVNYTFKEECIMDAVENCCLYIGNFDPEKSKNPFSYITTICYYAFLRRIQKEKNQLYVKYKMSQNASMHLDAAYSEQMGDDSNYTLASSLTEYSQEAMGNFIEAFEASKQRKLDKKKAKDIQNAQPVAEIPL